MTDTTNNDSRKSSPAYVAYHVRDREGADSVWTRLGAAWPHRDGKGFNIQIDVVPLDGRISLRIPSDKKN